MNEIIKELSMKLNVPEEDIQPYTSSKVQLQELMLEMVRIRGEKSLLAVGKGPAFNELYGDLIPAVDTIKICPLSHDNRLVLNRYLPYTLPQAFGRQTATFGAGDRLGLATPGHIRVLSRSSAKPVLAQQSKRELDLTGRNYEQVLDDVCFAVFQEGYKGGFGADGDHLKTIADIDEALDCGYTMITLDCSEHIGRGVTALDEIYGKAIDFAEKVYDHIKQRGKAIDFELSIDETEEVTTVEGHTFVAAELERRGIAVTSLAPRFTGEFQKGIDFIGDLSELEEQIRMHAAIADNFGYKLSIHSGSDKFDAFPIIGTSTNGRLHLKTSGTSWLEAVAAIALQDPKLYRRIHRQALKYFNEARSFYHVSADIGQVGDIDLMPDGSLINYLSNDNSRQLLHITYGAILRDPDLKNQIYQTLAEHEDIYYSRLENHIGRHLKLLGLV